MSNINHFGNIDTRVFSGIQPSGNLTLGNYLGAIKQFVHMQNNNIQSLYCIVDLHAITVWQNPQYLRHNTRQLVAAYIACGIDPQKSILFNQSQVSAHAELGWILNCVVRLGAMNRMTQFKDKASKNSQKMSLGLYAYPVLMAADILLYKATHVPVGDDQKQHVELTRDIAIKFNHDYGVAFFPAPKPLNTKNAGRIMSLRDGNKKMSKSDPSDLSRINITDSPDNIAKKIRKAKTDSQSLPEAMIELAARPEARNLINIYASLVEKSPQTVLDQFAGKKFSQFKPVLIDLTIAQLSPLNIMIKQLMNNLDEIDCILKAGATRANAIAKPILAEVKHIVGMIGT